jgi:hypothetical protein
MSQPLSEIAEVQIKRIKEYVANGASFEDMRLALENLWRIGYLDGLNFQIKNEKT